jgi:SH3-like domain-containing protein
MRIFAFILRCALLAIANTHVFASSTQPPRWVSADDVRVRAGPGLEHKVVGALPRGAELILKTITEEGGYCLIEGEGQYGYVACRYLSAERIKRRKSGEDGIDAAQRWVSANAVTLREAPRPDAAVVARMALNTIVTLLREAGGGYCEVRLTGGRQDGFTACRYLGVSPVVMAHVRGHRRADEALSPDYDPERAFWLEPSWSALESYVEHLKRLQPGIPRQGPWPRNEPLERMKAHLALGLRGPKPEPYVGWSELLRKASQNLDLSGEARRLQAKGEKLTQNTLRREAGMKSVANELSFALRIYGSLHDPISGSRM